MICERNGAIIVELDLPRPWKIRPGDYIYLRCLSMGLPSLLESHPFSIAWWDSKDSKYGESKKVYLLLSPQYGFTSRLLHRSNHNRPLYMLIDGPYGPMVQNSHYDTVLLFGNGIGIAALMPFIKSIIDDRKRSYQLTRRISLIWEIDRESKCLATQLWSR